MVGEHYWIRLVKVGSPCKFYFHGVSSNMCENTLKNIIFLKNSSWILRALQCKTLGLGKLSTVVHRDETNMRVNETLDKQFDNFRHKYQDFLPSPDVKWRNPIREKLEREDILRRRSAINIPEFYVGSILAVTTSNRHATDKSTKFVGICIMKQSFGLYSKFVLRNVIEHQGVEVLYSLYSPVIQKIEVLRLEKRLDNELYYLRDAPNEYSTFPFDMQAEYRDENMAVPINTTKVKINHKPWLQKYDMMNLKGVELPECPKKKLKKPGNKDIIEKYDLMNQYRRNIPEEEQRDIFNEVCDKLNILEKKHKSERKSKLVTKVKSSTTIF